MPGARNPERDEPISLHPLDPEVVLRALMGVAPSDPSDDEAQDQSSEPDEQQHQ
jgi:hypothetical protein